MARPRISDEERRSECFTIRLAPDERLALLAEAGRLRMSPTELARQRVLKGRVVVREHRQQDPRLVFQLGKIGVNLNQIARALNERQSVNPALINAAIEDLRPVIARLMLDPDAGDGVSVDEPTPARPHSTPRGPASGKAPPGGSG